MKPLSSLKGAVNEKTTELVTVKLEKHLYLSVVSHTFDIITFCR
jgi:hypothetical protein